jgi:hypothetical protein
MFLRAIVAVAALLIAAALPAGAAPAPAPKPAAAPVTTPAPAPRPESVPVATPIAEPDSMAPATVDTVTAPPDSVAGHARARWSEQPRFVMLRSVVVPGWGQWHNHARLKAVAVAGVEGWILGNVFADQHAMTRLLNDVHRAQADSDNAAYNQAVSEYNSHLDGFVSGQWLLAGVLAYAMIDAYVDAHFRTFDIDFRNDPALPRDAAPEGSPSGGARRGSSARLSLRWHF